MRKKTVILYNILFLCFLYFVIAFLFSLIYIMLDFLTVGYVVDHYSSNLHQQQSLDHFTRSFYFSFTTLFSLGYGDITPLGLSKGVAIVESMIGYILPYTIVLNYILFDTKITRRFLSNSNRKKVNKS
jgi:potassium channel LctB